ncbi:MAG: NAD(P)-binding protein [bacterium]|nr:NAD(P)-binding protein [bacterium]
MKKEITRRDFINGVSIAAASAAMMDPRTLLAEAMENISPGAGGDDYPPALTGLRGNHDGAYEVAHALAWDGKSPASYTDLDEEYDLVVVGTGISGLAAAYFYQQKAGEDKRILLLDNHDDFGGHARRNEFHYNGTMLLGGGGSGNFEDPEKYSPESKGLVADLGFDLDKLRAAQTPRGFQASMEAPLGMFNDRENYGADSVVAGHWLPAWQGAGNYKELIGALPLSEPEKMALIGFVDGSVELKKPLPDGDILQTMKSISYQTFATEYAGLSKRTTRLFDPYLRVTYCVGTDSISILEAIKSGMPGLGLLGPEALEALKSSGFFMEGVDFIFMPDGNASFARQIVRRLIPEAAPGETVEDLIDTRFDYSQLDRADHNVRLRLNSTVLNVVNEATKDGADRSVSVSYVQDGKALRVKAKHCILACYNGIIPHICPQLPDEQKQNLAYGVKSPLIVAHVLIRKASPFQKAGGEVYMCPDSYFALVTPAFGMDLGNYKTPTGPDDPLVVYMLTSPPVENDGTQTTRDLYRLGRHQLLATSFEDYEKTIREQLTGLFAATGFDADRDIEAITVNRWSHGYAYGYSDLYDPEWPEGEAPHELGRMPLGRISLAGSDTHADAHLNGAVDAGWRAVQEQLKA